MNAVLSTTRTKPLSAVCYVTDSSYIQRAKSHWAHPEMSLMVVVPHLPKNALIEWQVMGYNNDEEEEIVSDPMYLTESIESESQYEWNLFLDHSSLVSVIIGTCFVKQEYTKECLEKALLHLMNEIKGVSLSNYICRVFYNPLHLTQDWNLSEFPNLIFIPVLYIQGNAAFGISAYKYQKQIQK